MLTYAQVMRVVCLTSLVTDGIKKLDALKTELVQVYGLGTRFTCFTSTKAQKLTQRAVVDVIVMLYTLEELGLLKRSEAPSGHLYTYIYR
jgi:hypothetical protein